MLASVAFVDYRAAELMTSARMGLYIWSVSTAGGTFGGVLMRALSSQCCLASQSLVMYQCKPYDMLFITEAGHFKMGVRCSFVSL